jgi:hypothetical protein
VSKVRLEAFDTQNREKNTEQVQLLARVIDGMFNFRQHGRRGLVGTRANAADDRGIASVPSYTSMDDAWRILQYFSRTDINPKLRFKFWELAGQDAERPLLDYRLTYWKAARHIASVALTALRYGQKHRLV